MSSTYSREVAAAFDAVAETYDQHYSTPGDRVDSEHIFNRAMLLNPGGGRFIDLGCGPGTALAFLNVSSLDYLGIDISERAIKVASVRWPLYRFVWGDESEIEPSSASFILGGFGPLQHVWHLDRFSETILRALRPGGRFLLMGRTRQVPTRVLASEGLTTPYKAADVRSAFCWAAGLRVYGHRRFTPTWLPYLAQRWLMSLEGRRCNADRSEWLVVEGQR